MIRFKRARNEDAEEYEILQDGGFRKAERLPLSWNTLRWILEHELDRKNPDADCWSVLGAAGAQAFNEVTEIGEELLRRQPWYADLRRESDYYRMDAICRVRDAWPASLAAVRKLEYHQLEALAHQLTETPHNLCYYAHSRHYGLGEMPFASLEQLSAPVSRVCMGAARLYEMLKQERLFRGHTVFVQATWLATFARKYPGFAHEASLQWLLREGHLLPLDKDAVYVERDRLFAEPSPVYYLQFPRDDKLKERILGHLRRIFNNFREARGEFTARDPDEPVVAAPKGPLNYRQRAALDHVLNNPLTIVQGGPGSGKTAFGVEHLSCLFQVLLLLCPSARERERERERERRSHGNVRKWPSTRTWDARPWGCATV